MKTLIFLPLLSCSQPRGRYKSVPSSPSHITSTQSTQAIDQLFDQAQSSSVLVIQRGQQYTGLYGQ